MPNIRPDRLVLRCYGHRKKNGRYYGVCLELNIAAEVIARMNLKINSKV